MRNGDSHQPAERGNQRFGRLIQRGDAVPEDIALRRAQQKRTLANGKVRHRLDAEKIGSMLLPLTRMGGEKGRGLYPLLARHWHKLPLIVANVAPLWPGATHLVRRAAGFTQYDHYIPLCSGNHGNNQRFGVTHLRLPI